MRTLWRRGLDLYLAATAAWAVVWVRRGDRGALGLVNALAFWLLGLGLPAGGVRLATSRNRFARLLALGWVAAGLALLFGRYRWLRPAAVARQLSAARSDGRPAGAPDARSEAQSLRVLSMNILYDNRSAEDAVRLIQRVRADVVLVQELEPEMSRQLHDELDLYDHCHWYAHHRRGGGMGFFSRYPFEVTGSWDFPATRPYAIRITVDGPTGRVDLYNVHLLSLAPSAIQKTGLVGNFSTRADEAGHLADEMTARGVPALALGDWNMTEGNDAYCVASARLTDAWVAAGRGPGWTWPRTGFPPHVPVLRLDYCFCTPDVRPAQMRVLYEWVGSDHCPILVDAQLACKEIGW